MEKIDILVKILLAFASARLLGRAFYRAGLPSVVGELLAGAILGPAALGLLGHSEILDALSELGVIILLFTAGLETRLGELTKVLGPGVRVGILGVILPFALGFALGTAVGFPVAESLFVGAAMTATSVGITIRVLCDLGIKTDKVVRTILAAAVLDDILGLVVLVAVKRLALGGFNPLELSLLVLEAVAFVGFVALAGPKFVRRRRTFLSSLSCDFIFEVSVVLMLALSILSEYIGLAAIVGAFLAGLVLSELREFTTIEDRFTTLGWFFVPFFFVAMGLYLDINLFTSPVVLLETAVFSIVAILGKLVGGYLGSRAMGRSSAIRVGVGMIPRGEVGIVVAGTALAAGAISNDVYASVIGMVLVTTIISPFLIKAVYAKRSEKPAES
jgi:Kef-type K+ transport system membrane component KefB